MHPGRAEVNDRKSTLPMHGKRDMPVGTMEAIKKDLGLKGRM